MKNSKNTIFTAIVLAMLVVLSGVTVCVDNVVGSTSQTTDQNTNSTNTTTTEIEQKISGAVYNGSKDKPLDSAIVVLYTIDGKQTKTLTDENGSFAFEDLEVGTYLVVVFKDGYMPQTQVFTIRKAQSITRDFILKYVASIGVGKVDGYIRNETGVPISSADVSIQGMKTHRTTKTNSNGYFSFDSIIEGTHELLALKRGFLPAKIKVNVTANTTITNTLTMKSIGELKSYTIQGSVIGNGTVVENTTVFLRAPAFANESTTDENGQYDVVDIPEGRAVLKISNPDLIEQDVALDVMANDAGGLDAFLYRGWLFERDLGNVNEFKKEIETAKEIIGKKTMEIKEIESGKKNVANKATAKALKEKEINAIYTIIKIYEKVVEDIQKGLPLANIDFAFLPGATVSVVNIIPDEVNGSVTIKVIGTLRAGVRENVTVTGETTITIKGNVTNGTEGISAEGKMEIHSIGDIVIKKKQNAISLKGELIFDGGKGKLGVSADNVVVKAHGIGHSRIKTKLENNVMALNFKLAEKEVEILEGMLSGNVVDNQNTPISNATVIVEGFGYTAKDTTDSLGNYDISNIPVGKAVAMVVKSGYIPDKRIVEVKLATVENFKLVKPAELPKGTFGGIVINENGAPISGAKIILRNNVNAYKAETVGNGTFAIKDVTNGEYIVETSAPGYISKIDVVNVVGKRTFTLKIMLKKVPEKQKITIEGTISNETNAPVSNAVLDLRGFGFGNGAQTNTTGSYVFANISEGVYILKVGKTNYAVQDMDLGVVYDRKTNKTYALLSSNELAGGAFNMMIDKTNSTEISKVNSVLPSAWGIAVPRLSQVGALFVNYSGNTTISITGGEIHVSGTVSITIIGNVSSDANVTGLVVLTAKGHIVMEREEGSIEMDGQLAIAQGAVTFANSTNSIAISGKGAGLLSADILNGKIALNFKLAPVVTVNNLLKGKIVYEGRGGELKPLKAIVIIKGANGISKTINTGENGTFEATLPNGAYQVYSEAIVTTGAQKVRLVGQIFIGLKGGQTQEVVIKVRQA
ncbi:MAG: carboxypeptidase-like regulatory domain-containing protein [Thermoplasmata archaeon]